MYLLITLGDITNYVLPTTGHLHDISDTVIFLFPSYVHLRTGQLHFPPFLYPAAPLWQTFSTCSLLLF